MNTDLIEIYNKLLNHFEHQNWWPGETADEIIIGAILTQSVNWKNVEKAITNLKNNNLCRLEAIYNTPVEKISPLIRSTIYFNIKAEKLKNFATFVHDDFDGSLQEMSKQYLDVLRKQLLGVKGIGAETADSILLYAGNHSIFVIDDYTKRVFSRIGYLSKDGSYDQFQQFFMSNLPHDVDLFNDFHAQIVMLAKTYCKRRNPDCERCPLEIYCLKQDL